MKSKFAETIEDLFIGIALVVVACAIVSLDRAWLVGQPMPFAVAVVNGAATGAVLWLAPDLVRRCARRLRDSANGATH